MKSRFDLRFEDGAFWVYRDEIPLCMIPDSGEPGDTAEEDAKYILLACILLALHSAEESGHV